MLRERKASLEENSKDGMGNELGDTRESWGSTVIVIDEQRMIEVSMTLYGDDVLRERVVWVWKEIRVCSFVMEFLQYLGYSRSHSLVGMLERHPYCDCASLVFLFETRIVWMNDQVGPVCFPPLRML